MVDRLIGLWRRLTSGSYPSGMGVARRGTPEPAGPPLDLSRYYGLWVAVLRGEVVAAAATPRELAFRMNTLPAADRRDAVVQKAHPPSGAVVVGMG